MGYLKTVLIPVFLSLGVHAVMGWSIGQQWQAELPSGPQTVQISYPETPIKAGAVKKKLKGIPVPRMPLPGRQAGIEPEPLKSVEPTDFQRQLETKLKKQRAALSKLSAEPVTGAEIMADPQKGKLFISYFSDVKKKIQKTLIDRFSKRHSARGSVTLVFVLSSKGFVEKVSVLPKGTQGAAELHDLAVRCLRESAPFGSFPPELGSDPVAFNVTIFFDGR